MFPVTVNDDTFEVDTLYKLWVGDRQTGKWTVLSDWSTKKTIDYTPSKSGRYTFTVHVKHKSSSSNLEDDYRAVDVNEQTLFLRCHHLQ